jgi:hypothetical protein
MTIGRVYIWSHESGSRLYGSLSTALVPLLNLDSQRAGGCRLTGRYVDVRNGGALNGSDPFSGAVRQIPLGPARPDTAGDFLFDPGRGGGRAEKIVFCGAHNSSAQYLESGVSYPEEQFRSRYIQASRFGEVNTYFHLDRMAAYVDELLHQLGASSLPRVLAIVNAHDSVIQHNGVRDGVRRAERWMPFQGGHYRLSTRSTDPAECTPVSPDGEIHLGPGRQLSEHGALVQFAGGRYRANASHNAGILYHEYGHHITRHTADFRLNALSRAERQNNQKAAIDEGTCDYWAAAMLGTPHIWILHHRHDHAQIHPRSLTSPKTMAHYDHGDAADPHANGTIWGAALWELRTILATKEADGARQADLLLVKTLLLLGNVVVDRPEADVRSLRDARSDYATGLSCLLLADDHLNGGRHRHLILPAFAKRDINPAPGLRRNSQGTLLLESRDAAVFTGSCLGKVANG